MHYENVDGTRLSSQDLKDRYPILFGWLDEMLRGWNLYHNILMIESIDPPNGPVNASVRLNLFLFTKKFRFRITVRPPRADSSKLLARDQDAGYIGASSLTRWARAGEDWMRGNDLTDGPFTKDVFDAIMRDIVRWELVPLEIGDEEPFSLNEGKRSEAIPPAPVIPQPDPNLVGPAMIPQQEGLGSAADSTDVVKQTTSADTTMPVTVTKTEVGAPMESAVKIDSPIGLGVLGNAETVPTAIGQPTALDPMGGTLVALSDKVEDHQ